MQDFAGMPGGGEDHPGNVMVKEGQGDAGSG